MGILLDRLFDYPLKTSRPCFFEPEFPEDKSNVNEIRSKYDQVVEKIEKKLLEKRIENISNVNDRNLLMKYPDWNDSTIAYLQSLFLTFCNEETKMVDFEGFASSLKCLSPDYEVSENRCRKCFCLADANQDGFINYIAFLELIYNLENYASSVKKITEKIDFINELSIGEQLENGLF